MGSLDDEPLISRPSLTMLVWPFARSVASYVSSRASSRSQVRAMVFVRTADSLRMTTTVVKTASGPETKKSMAACGTYVVRKRVDVTVMERVT